MRHIVTVAAVAVASCAASAAAIFAGSTAPATPPSSRCNAVSTLARLPRTPSSFRAGAAGRVLLTFRAEGTIAVSSIAPTGGYRPIVDKDRGSSVEVYFGQRTNQVVFSADARAGTLEVRVTTCR